MKESNFQVLFKNNNRVMGVFELKIAKGPSLRYDSIAPHQLDALIAVASNKGLYHKINDASWGGKMRFTNKKPFDCFFLSKLPAYVVIGFYTPRKPWRIYYIAIQHFLWMFVEAVHNNRKSLNETEARLMAVIQCHDWKFPRQEKTNGQKRVHKKRTKSSN